MKQIIAALVACLALTAVPSTTLASNVDLPPYQQYVVPGYAVSDQEMVFEVANNLNASVDTYHVDFINRQWTKTNEEGVLAGSWTAAEDTHFNPAQPKGILCLAGPWAFAGCVVAVPISFATCQASQATLFAAPSVRAICPAAR